MKWTRSRHCRFLETLSGSRRCAGCFSYSRLSPFAFRNNFPSYSDIVSTFTSLEFAEILQSYGIQHAKASTGHPQSNGLCERKNRTEAEVISPCFGEFHYLGETLAPIIVVWTLAVRRPQRWARSNWCMVVFQWRQKKHTSLDSTARLATKSDLVSKGFGDWLLDGRGRRSLRSRNTKTKDKHKSSYSRSLA